MKNSIQNIKENYKLLLGVFFLGLVFGWLFFHSSAEASHSVSEIESHERHNHESSDPTTWTCSMHPQIKQDKPGLCPICAMDLIPLTKVSSVDEDIDPNEIMMSESAAKLAEIQTSTVAKGRAKKLIYLQGKVEIDERNIAKLTARFGGRIEKLFINFTGQNVKKGEKLATIYSPELVTAQRELLEAVAYKESRPSLYNAARGKLKLWDLNEEQIDAIEGSAEPQLYFDILSPITGTVSMRHVAIGDYVKEGKPLFQVVDLSKLWVMFDAYESDLPWIKLDDKISFTVQSLPGKKFTAKVSYIDPFINGKTRITKVRVEIPNAELSLKPEMFTSGLVESKIAENTSLILIPKSAILWTGKRAVVYVKVPNRKSPSFRYREIVLGAEAGAFYVLTEGLELGEEIATNGVFKIDAAAQLQGLPSMMNPDGGRVSTGHNHGGETMSEAEMAQMEKPNESKQIFEVPQAFKEQVSQSILTYLKMKDAFVKAEEKQVTEEARKILSDLNKVNMALLKGEAHNVWMKLLDPLKNDLNGIIEMDGIEMKRSHFSDFSNTLTEVIDAFSLKIESPLYLEYCPMAFNDQGAFWISAEKEIRNPYFGDKMLKCGEVKRELK